MGSVGSVGLCQLAPTPINKQRLIYLLDSYPEQQTAQFLAKGFSEGFELYYSGPRLPVEFPNLQSVLSNLSIAQQKIDKEVALGRVAGPFTSRPLVNLRVNPLGLVPKQTPGEYRMIHHLSYPPGYSINDFIEDDKCNVEYSRFDDAVELVAKLGQDTLLAKADIKSAFRLLPVSPRDFELLGMKINGKFYVDKCLPMGVRCAPAYFEKFSTFVEFLVRRNTRSSGIIHYMDDFLCVGKKGDKAGSCSSLVVELKATCEFLGIPLAPEKSEGPATKLSYLGLEIDTTRMQVRVPPDKLQDIRQKIRRAGNKNTLAIWEVQSIIGSLSFICKAVKPGRAFLRRLIDMIKGQSKTVKHISLSEGAKTDLQMWLKFLESFNGTTIIPAQGRPSHLAIQLLTDASGGTGYGAFVQGKWFYGRWPEKVANGAYSIAWKEMFPIVAAMEIWGQDLEGKQVIFNTDNMSVKHIVNKQTSQCPKIMSLVRHLVLTCLRFNILFKAVHVWTKHNVIADSLSRLQLHRFKLAAPHAEKEPSHLPEWLWEI